jgi:cytochrome P450 PksS
MRVIKVPNLASPKFKANPYPFYARLRSEAPVYRFKMAWYWPWPVWLVTRYDDVLTVLKDERISKEWDGMAPGFLIRLLGPISRNMLSLDPPDHTRLRGLVNKAFTPRLVEGQRERIATICGDLLRAGTVNGGMDIVRDYALPLPLTVIADMLGIPPEDRRQFHSWTKSMIAGFFSARAGLALPAMSMFIRYLHRLFARRRTDPQDDLITALVKAEEAGDKLTEDELVAMVDHAPHRRLRNHRPPDRRRYPRSCSARNSGSGCNITRRWPSPPSKSCSGSAALWISPRHASLESRWPSDRSPFPAAK